MSEADIENLVRSFQRANQSVEDVHKAHQAFKQDGKFGGVSAYRLGKMTELLFEVGVAISHVSYLRTQIEAVAAGSDSFSMMPRKRILVDHLEKTQGELRTLSYNMAEQVRTMRFLLDSKIVRVLGRLDETLEDRHEATDVS